MESKDKSNTITIEVEKITTNESDKYDYVTDKDGNVFMVFMREGKPIRVQQLHNAAPEPTLWEATCVWVKGFFIQDLNTNNKNYAG